jgi:putative effector of murein hydrolase
MFSARSEQHNLQNFELHISILIFYIERLIMKRWELIIGLSILAVGTIIIILILNYS